MKTKHLFVVLSVFLGALASGQGQAQSIYTENFTGASTTNSWYFFNGACLTAGTSSSTTSPGTVPGCQTVWSNYYSSRQDSDPYLVGGNSGYLGASTAPSGGATQTPDPVNSGALRFTNGHPYGHQERGAIVSANTFDTGSGIQVTFKTVTYDGDGGGAGKDGADGISFFLMNGSVTPTAIGATGGSLGYSCTNETGNVPYDGLTGGYIGLGIDEYGNFLNGTNLASGYTGTNSATGDNTAYGYGYKPDRIGMRGAGNISWAALTAAYGSYQGSSLPYYPASLTTTYGSSTYSCASGSNSNNEFCWSCPTTYAGFPGAPSTPTGTFTNTATLCSYTLYSSATTCPAATSYTSYSGAPNTPAGLISFSTTAGTCIDTLYSTTATCPTSYTAYSGAPSTPAGSVTSANPCKYKVTIAGVSTTYTGPAKATFTGPATTTYTTTPSTSTVTVSGGSGTTLAQSAVLQACSTGNLYNYYDPAAPVAVTTSTLTTSTGATNTANPAGILDYAPIPNAYKELTAFTIANESATTRSQATPILYNLKVTQNGLLSLSYSTGGAYSYIIQNQSITTANGPLPSTFRFGFAGSTGGDTNIHEIMCFKAASASTSGSSSTVNQREAARVEAGTQAYFAYYNPNDWTGSITANTLIDTGGVVTVNAQANWDAQCLLSGTPTGAVTAGGGCANTGVAGPTSATPAPTSRVMLTWDTTNNVGIPFEWTSLNTNQQTVLDDENGTPDSTAASQYRLNYLRGDRSNEITTAGTGLYRARDGILGDIVDSSPTWVGPPQLPYTATWGDRLYTSASMSENTGTQTYRQYVTAEQGRLNVVYAGANDGFLHGFEAGSFDPLGYFCGTTNSSITCAATPNDGKEVLAYIPGSTLYSPALSTTAGGCAGTNISTGTVAQNIHGWTPAIGGSPATSCETPELDYSATPYGHNFFVDATPGSADLFYNDVWHTWLVGGLGMGGAAIYALDVTNPSTFSEGGGNPQNLVIGEWNSSTITCVNPASGCGTHLGNTFGTPQIRRLHNGSWAAIFGNGFGSAAGDAGIYVMVISNSAVPTYANTTFYYLSTNPSGAASNAIFSGTGSQSGGVVTISAVTAGTIAVGDVLSGAGVEPGSTVISLVTGTGGTGTYNVSTSGTVASGAVTVGNGIAYTTPTDLDGDHITDYVYAGDLQGNIWRFDLTSNNPSQWGVTNSGGASINKPAGTLPGQGGGGTPAPLFTATSPTGQVQRITTQLLVLSDLVQGSGQFILVEFGTGQRTQITNAAPESYIGGTQSLYGVWDWNLSAWNAQSATQYASLAASATGLAAPYSLSHANLTAQTLTLGTMGTVNGTNVTVCWAGTATCTAANTSFGWYANLPGTSEQIIYNPVYFQGSILVNSTIPAVNTATSCTINTDTGFTYGLNITNGGVFNNTFPTYSYTNPTTNITTQVSDPTAAGVQYNATGSVDVVTTSEGKTNIVFQTVAGGGGGASSGTCTGAGCTCTGATCVKTGQYNVPSNTKASRLTWVERR
ncbi:MAG: PilC/PilY family type IV pilus protein [Steroidobacteraceae bacterium]